MQNNSFDLGDYVLCGTRGWKCPGDDEFSAEDKKIYSRELQRLELSLKEVKGQKPIIAALHFPPFNAKHEPSGFVELLTEYNVITCIYGHLHGEANRNAFEGIMGNTLFKNVSADYLSFIPYKLA
jgi:predicted phosphohydrolase